MTTESQMVPVGTAGNRLKAFGYSLETRYDGAKRQWLHFTRPGKRGKMRVYSGQVFLRDLTDAEQGKAHEQR